MSWFASHWREIAEVVCVVVAWIAPSPVRKKRPQVGTERKGD